MKTFRYFINLFFASFFLISGLQAQQDSCYVRLEDASGYTPTSEQLAELEAAACALIDSFPAEFRDSFRVYDFGFYLHQEVTEGGYPEPFAKKILEVQNSSPYYLLFGKQTDRGGVYTRFWVGLRLPNSGIFYCIDQLLPSLRGDLTTKYGIIANEMHNANEKSYFGYHDAEISAIDSLRSYIDALKECCIPPGQQRRGSGCTSCVFSKSEFTSLLRNKDFTETKCMIQAVADSSQSNSNMVNRIIRVDGEAFNVDMEIQKFIDSYKGPDSSKSASIYTFNYPDKCSDLDSLLEIAEDDSSCLVIVAGMMGDIGENGFLFLKIFEKENCFIKSNGPGYIYVYDMQGVYQFSFWGNHYHGIYFTDSPFYLGRIDFKKNMTKGDAIAKFSNFFISDSNITYLKEMQKKCNINNREYGGLVSFGTEIGEMVFEECTSCSATATSLSGSLDLFNYSNYESKDFVAHWHTHPNAPYEESQTPSGWIRAIQYHEYKYDFFLYMSNNLVWQAEFLSASTFAKNTWRLPGRIGIIAGNLGITVYRFAGNYYKEIGSLSGYFPCEYHPEGVCYKKEGTIENLNLLYSWVKYDLSYMKK